MRKYVIPVVLSFLLLAGCEESRDRAPSSSATSQVTTDGKGDWVSVSMPYELSLVTVAKTPTGTVASRVKGRLSFHALDEASGKAAQKGPTLRLAARLDDVSFVLESSSKQPHAELERELRQPVVVELRDGLVESIFVDKSVSAAAISTWRTIFATFQIPAIGKNQTTWKSEEADATGLYAAEYRRDKDHITKTKRTYSKVLAAFRGRSAMLDHLPRIQSSETRLKFADGTLERIELNETVQVPLDLGASYEVKQEFVASRTTGTVAKLKENFSSWLKSARRVPADAPASADLSEARAQFDAQRAEGWTFDSALAALQTSQSLVGQAAEDDTLDEKELRARRQAAFSALPALIRQSEGDGLGAVRAALVSHVELTGEILSALSSVGSEDAAHLLVEIANDSKRPDGIRSSALIALGRVHAVGQKDLETVHELAKSPTLGTQALYALGSVSRRLRDSGEEKKAQLVGDWISKRLSEATNDQERLVALRAFANAGSSDHIGEVLPHINSKQAKIRAAAYAALRHVESPRTKAALIEGLKAEREAEPQLAILNAIQNQQLKKAYDVAVSDFLKRDDLTENVRTHAARLQKTFN